MQKRLIVNADDYGRTPGVSAGIRSAHRNGIVTSTTVMLNMAGVDVGLSLALQECPQLGLGVHLVLTAGRPILPTRQVPTLTDSNGHFPTAQQFINMMPGMDPDQVRAEWTAQILIFIQLTNRRPDHLDSHHHTSYFSQALFRIMLELAAEFGCAIRPPLAEGGIDLPLDLPAELGDQPMEFIPELTRQFSPRMVDDFYSSFYGPAATLENLLELVDKLPAGTSEIMCHPGFSDPELVHGSSYNVQREVELGILSDPAIKTLLQDRSIQLINYAQL